MNKTLRYNPIDNGYTAIVMISEIIEHEPNYRMPIHYMGMDIPDVVEMTKWREGRDIITTYRDGNRFWHFRASFQSNDMDKGCRQVADPWDEPDVCSDAFSPYFSSSNVEGMHR